MRAMRVPVAVIISVAFVLCAGCGKKSEQVAAPPATNATDSAAGDVAPPEPPQPPLRDVLARAEDQAKQAVVGEVDAFLTGELRAFIQQKNRLPASFSELARARLDSVPRPPAGKKWVIDTESLEVKSVNAQ